MRMIRGHKGVDWSAQLAAEDLPFLHTHIDGEEWYPMATFERLGNAILRVIAGNNLELVRQWGRFSVEQLLNAHSTLAAPNDPVETLNRFRVLRSTFFDFDALDIRLLIDDEAQIGIHYHMGKTAEEAASHQTMGFFERLLELSGATDVTAHFGQRSWAGDQATLLHLTWRTKRVVPTLGKASPQVSAVGRLRRKKTDSR
ncbi:MAG: hypothetical protein HYZ27_12350 [Deltaproteobacteria bacterium]|nr:hypothetical protein [Deltaproteobacteria bacterium]